MEIREKIKLQMDDDFFKEEIRCDYRVTEKTKKIWAIELDLLNELLCVCKKHHIKVTAFAGTLLGAIRHGGMIPWDDDIDVALTRVEFERLCRVAPQEFKHPYFFQTANTDPQYLFGFARLRNSLTTGRISGYNSDNYNNGIYIDIFVLDGFIDNEKLLRRQQWMQNRLMTIANFYKHNIMSNSLRVHKIKQILFPVFDNTVCKLIHYETITNAYYRNLTRYNKIAKKISLMTHNYEFVNKYWCNKNDLDDIIYVPFESLMIPIPSRYDDMLKHMYGEYMEFPPIEKRGAWHDGAIVFDPDTPYKKF